MSARGLGIEGEIRAVDRLVRLALVGCGSHAYRNILPVLRFVAEADLVACADLNVEKAELYARTFGAPSAYGDYRRMLDEQAPDGVILVLGFGEDGSPLYPEMAAEILARGTSVWMEKPPASTVEGVEQMIAARPPGVVAQVGFKKMFAPAVVRVRQLAESLGPVESYTYRYSVDLPAEPGRLELPDARRFIDDFVHVASVVVHVVGPPERITPYRSVDGDGTLVLEHAGGTLGTVHLSKHASMLDTVEDGFFSGRGWHVRIDNGVNVTFFPRGWRGPYGRSVDFLPEPLHDDAVALEFGPVQWFPELSLGTLHGGTQFLQGYFAELREFVLAIAEGREPDRATLEDALDVMAMVDAVRKPFGVAHDVRGASKSARPPAPAAVAGDDEAPVCARTRSAFQLKDGWNFVCKTCGATATVHEPRIRPCPYGDGVGV